ncbi:MAG: molybdate ABC transporter substrate-binding protein [Desulfovibrionaceae bacterium]|nr:molybdate ABC transporter substrate-binding protein [Desulfovibrionaceae bacterium]
MSFIRILIAFAAALALPWSVRAGEINVAVAANFAEPAKALAAIFEKTTGHTAKLSFGATGTFYAQIRNGAPFDVFLAADAERPALLEKEGSALPGSRFTYATGQLALWSAKPGLVDNQGKVLKSGGFNKLAIANPKNAPYGAAAMQAMERLGLQAALQPKLVTGESIGQAYSFIATGNAELGFVALSQVLEGGRLKSGSMWIVPERLHAPIVQDAVALKRAQGNPAAQAWLDLLRSPNTKELIRSYGYSMK